MPIEPRDLPAEIQEILDTEAAEGAPVSEQPVCQADVRVTSQLASKPTPPFRVLPWRVENARKGDLLLTPGGEGGLIGGILWRLDRRQYFSHMGIFIEDGTRIRHATAIGNRTKHVKFLPRKVFTRPAPTNGIEPDALRYQWPGTVTQSIEEAYLTWRDHPTELDPVSGEKVPSKEFSRFDPVTEERFAIDALTFGIATFNDRASETDPPNWIEVPPVVVKPCSFVETRELRSALHRVADAAKDIHGHYRIFAYSRGDIAADSNFAGPPMLETEGRDPGAACTGARFPMIRITKTVPVVCSTLIWWAIQEANRKGGPRIVIDNRPASARHRLPGAERCSHDLTRPFTPKVDDARAATGIDGMYRYLESERLRSGTWLHDEYLVKTVRREIDDAIPTIYETLGGLGGVSLNWLRVVLASNPLGLVLLTIAQTLGLSVTVLEELIEWSTDMPDDVATQVCNTFAFDKSEEVDNALWKQPGAGFSVSPDDILNEWAGAQGIGPNGEVLGLYGHNEVARVAPPAYDRNPPRPSSWQISQGKCDAFRGTVVLLTRDSRRVPAHGARVRIGSHFWYTGSDGTFTASGADRGRYWTEADYRDPVSGLIARSKGRPINLGAGGLTSGRAVEYILALPPQTRRLVTVSGKMYLVNRSLNPFSDDWIGQPHFVLNGTPRYLDKEAYGFPPDREEFARQRAPYLGMNPDSPEKPLASFHSEGVADWGACQILLTCHPSDDGRSVNVFYQARLVENDELEDLSEDPEAPQLWSEVHSFVIPPTGAAPGSGFKLPQISLLRKPANPVRAYIDLEIRNVDAQ